MSSLGIISVDFIIEPTVSIADEVSVFQIGNSFIICVPCVSITKMERETEQIGIESLIENIDDRFDYIAEIHVAHIPSASDVSQLHITVHTGEAESFEQYLDLTTTDEVLIDTGEAEPLSLPFDIMATVDGAGHMQDSEGTTVYMDDNVMGAESRELEAGLSMLRKKLAGECPSCEAKVDTFRDHYRDNRTCREAERV